MTSEIYVLMILLSLLLYSDLMMLKCGISRLLLFEPDRWEKKKEKEEEIKS